MTHHRSSSSRSSSSSSSSRSSSSSSSSSSSGYYASDDSNWTTSYARVSKDNSLALKFMGYAAGRPRRATGLKKKVRDVGDSRSVRSYSTHSSFGPGSETRLYWVYDDPEEYETRSQHTHRTAAPRSFMPPAGFAAPQASQFMAQAARTAGGMPMGGAGFTAAAAMGAAAMGAGPRVPPQMAAAAAAGGAMPRTAFTAMNQPRPPNTAFSGPVRTARG